ncbi:hypothetical protein C0991_006405 [Blastosporella zonata]|nr:hypothetical protein C0991_006405 [Blastosporella zonata]
MSLHSLPDEIWTIVFQAFESSADLLKVVQTCKYLYSLAIGILYRDIRWRGPLFYASNVPFWKRHSSSIELAPTSLTVSISLAGLNNIWHLYDPAIVVVEEDGTCTATPELRSTQIIDTTEEEAHDSKKVSYFASHRMYTAITQRISTFTALRDLIFHLCVLPDMVSPAIKLLPRLRRLSIQYCTFPALMKVEPDPTFSELPITELTLWFLKNELGKAPNSNYAYMFLCTARNLRKLNIEWSSINGRFLEHATPGGLMAPLTGLTDLKLRFAPHKSWTSDVMTEAAKDCLRAFLLGSPNIKRFTWVGKCLRFTFPREVLPNLTSYSGWMGPGMSLLETRPDIDNIEITGTDRKTSDLISILENIGKYTPRLKSLRFGLYMWDTEIMYVIMSLFPCLRDIRIAFEFGSLSEQFLLSLGALFLYHLPDLESLEIYRAVFPRVKITSFGGVAFEHIVTKISSPEVTPVDDDGFVKVALDAWRKSCPLLRTVQLTKTSIWRRSFDGDEWCKRELPTPNLTYELY